MSAYFNTFETQQEFLNFKNSEDFLINSVNYVKENNSLSYGAVSKTQYNGHVDVEGLREIGWTDDDIAYYQTYGVNWNEKDDMYHKVSEDNKALYGVLTAENIQDYIDRIVYLPKIDTSNVTDMANMFYNCHSLITIPQLDTSNVIDMGNTFYNCHSLITIPQLDTSNVHNMSSMFSNCHSLVTIPQLDTSNVEAMVGMFNACYSLVSVPQLDTSNVNVMPGMFNNCFSLVTIPQIDTSNVTIMGSMFANCYSLVSVPQLDTSNVNVMGGMFAYCYSLVSVPQLDTSNLIDMGNTFNACYSLTHIKLKNLQTPISFAATSQLYKESLLYIINNVATTAQIAIQLHPYVYEKLSNDTEIIAALDNHPNILLGV